jgi:hypothetical protein
MTDFIPTDDVRARVAVGDRLWFAEEKQAYRVKGITTDRRWAICTKPFNPRHTVIYSVIDFDDEVRGVDNYGSLGYESDEDCANALAYFEAGDACHSRRHRPIDLYITKHESNSTLEP